MKKRSIIAVLVVLLLIGGWWYSGSRPTLPAYETVTVTRGMVENVVSVTGHVEPVDRISLSFPQGGRIARIAVTEGQAVRAGDLIAVLDQDQLQAGIREAEARAVREAASLRQLIAPVREEDRAVKEATVQEAELRETNSREGLYTAIARAFSNADDALHEEADELFSGTGEGAQFGVRFEYGTTKYILQGTASEELAINEGRQEAEEALVRIAARVDDRTNDLARLTQSTEEDLAIIDRFLTALAAVVNAYIPDDTAAQTVYENFQTSVASARSAVSTARSDVRTARATYDAAIAARKVAQQEYTKAVAGVTSESRAVQEASLRVAQEAVTSAKEAADTAVIRAPKSGTVARTIAAVGETVSAYSPVVEILTEGAYEVELYIPEADIARVKIGDQATVTFDAFERTQIFDAEVFRIALSETVREGVPTYKTRLSLLHDEVREVVLRPGMTADVDITTDVRENVVLVPLRSIVRDGERTYVHMLDTAGELVERTIVTGLRGSSGTTEVVEGLSEGEKVVLYIPADTLE